MRAAASTGAAPLCAVTDAGDCDLAHSSCGGAARPGTGQPCSSCYSYTAWINQLQANLLSMQAALLLAKWARRPTEQGFFHSKLTAMQQPLWQAPQIEPAQDPGTARRWLSPPATCAWCYMLVMNASGPLAHTWVCAYATVLQLARPAALAMCLQAGAGSSGALPSDQPTVRARASGEL